MTEPLDALSRFLAASRRLVVLSGAGCSTDSGIPDYRDENGDWKHRRPVLLADFLRSETVRRRYWARAVVGWDRVAGARPNDAHRALAALERAGRLHCVITQNVDRLHQRAGSRRVIDLHGRLDRVECLSCRRRYRRDRFQLHLLAENPGWAARQAPAAPDGDAHLELDTASFRVPACPCGGILKPAVVFFGEGVPAERTRRAFQRLEEADALLIVGSSLMVFSGYRFARHAARRKLPIAAVNLGRTRADDLLDVRVAAPCGPTLTRAATRLGLAPDSTSLEAQPTMQP